MQFCLWCHWCWRIRRASLENWLQLRADFKRHHSCTPLLTATTTRHTRARYNVTTHTHVWLHTTTTTHTLTREQTSQREKTRSITLTFIQSAHNHAASTLKTNTLTVHHYSASWWCEVHKVCASHENIANANPSVESDIVECRQTRGKQFPTIHNAQ